MRRRDPWRCARAHRAGAKERKSPEVAVRGKKFLLAEGYLNPRSIAAGRWLHYPGRR